MTRRRREDLEEGEESPRLRVPRSEAENRLGAQVRAGEALLEGGRPSSEEALRELDSKYYTWLEYTEALLRKLIAPSKAAEDFSWSVGFVIGNVHDSIVEKYRRTTDDIESRLRRLKSIIQRLELMDEPPTVVSATPAPLGDGGPTMLRRVFLVHGHDDRVKNEVARFMERIGLTVVILHEQADEGQTIIEKFTRHALAGFAVVLLTSDDEGRSQGSDELLPRARQNVILELGYFLGKMSRSRVSTLRTPGVEVPSDLGGVLYIDLDAAGGWKLRLAKELQTAGMLIDPSKIL